MEKATLDLVAQYGVFAALFVALLWYVLRQNERRESRLMDIIDRTTPILDHLQRDISAIKEHLGLSKGD